MTGSAHYPDIQCKFLFVFKVLKLAVPGLDEA